MLKDLTIVAIDSLNYQATKFALDHTREIFPEAKVALISDKEFYPCDKFKKVEKFDSVEHSRICLQDVNELVDTNYALFVQYDGFPVQPQFWSDEFLNYDYIGGPFFKYERWIVGNGGFSLRSKKLLELTTQCQQNFDEDLGHLEDQIISVSARNFLESNGIKFPSVETAQKFSVVEPIKYSESFGFHGHGFIPEFLGKEKTLDWLDKIDSDYNIHYRNLYTMPYHLWKWDELERLRDFMIKANSISPGWTEKCWDECRWRIPLAHHVDDLFEIQKMIYVYGYTGS